MEEKIWQAGIVGLVFTAILALMLIVGINVPLTEIDKLPVGL